MRKMYRTSSDKYLGALANYLVWTKKPFKFDRDTIMFEATDSYIKTMYELKPSTKKIKFEIVWEHVI